MLTSQGAANPKSAAEKDSVASVKYLLIHCVTADADVAVDGDHTDVQQGAHAGQQAEKPHDLAEGWELIEHPLAIDHACDGAYTWRLWWQRKCISKYEGMYVILLLLSLLAKEAFYGSVCLVCS